MEVKIGDIFESKCSVIVNTVNCVGVMGKGIAKEFKKRYPDMFSDYVKRCNLGQVRTGKPYVFKEKSGIKILNFPTKEHWRSPSKLSYIVDGLDWFVQNYNRLNISSIAFPPLGCGNGGLDWDVVGPIMYHKLKNLPIEIEIYAPFGINRNETIKDFLSQRVVEEDFTGVSNLKINHKWFLILEAIKEINSNRYSLKVGRTIYQKICYVITRNGVNTGFKFNKGSYGPYSVDAKNSIIRLANSNLITERVCGKMVLLKVSDEILVDKDDFSDKEWNAMKKTVDLFGRIKSTEQAEIMSTVLFSYDKLSDAKSKISDKDVYDYVMSWKPHWEKEKSYEVSDTIHNLAMLAFISIEHSNLLLYPTISR